MKKAVLVIAALVVFTGFTFAQASVGAWGRGLFVAVAGGDDMVTADTASWGDAPRVGMTVSGTSDNVGFQIDINADNGAIAAGDQQKIWVKLFDMLTIQIGRVFEDSLRGSAGFGAWNWQRYDVIEGDSAIFMRVSRLNRDWDPTNVVISLAPVEGAFIFLSMSGLIAATPMLEDALPLGQYGAGYTIEGIGQIRAQYIGQETVIDEDWGIINAAFKLTMIEGLIVDLGADIPSDSDQNGLKLMRIKLYGSYAMDALTIHVYGDVDLYDEAHVGDDLGFLARLGVDYNMEGGIGINADVSYANDVRANNDDGSISGMVGVTMGFSNGLVGIALEITTTNFAGLGLVKANPDDIAFCLPIRLEYWF